MTRRKFNYVRRRKTGKINRKTAVWIALLAGILVLIPAIYKINSYLHPRATGTVRVDRYRDLNQTHLKHAKSKGIAPFKSDRAFREEKGKLVDDDKLVRISDSRYYVVNKLDHSHPYLAPHAAELLSLIGKRFQQKLDEKGKGKYYFRISSLLRTLESQKRLSRSNFNASSNSAHLYGTTFDITYKTVMKRRFPWKKVEVADAEAIKLLSQTIGELRREGRLVVVTEYKESCFHITAVK